MDGSALSPTPDFVAAYHDILDSYGECGPDDPWEEDLSYRVLDDPWSEAAARRVLFHRAYRTLQCSFAFRGCSKSEALRYLGRFPLLPLPNINDLQSLAWLLTASQIEVDTWRAEHPESAPFLSASLTFVGDGDASLRAFDLCFSSSAFTAAAEQSLRDEDKRVWEGRLAGLTLQALADQMSVSRERVRQRGKNASEAVASRFCAFVAHPFVGRLLEDRVFHLGEQVVTAASNTEAYLRPERIAYWIKATLAPEDAQLLLRISAAIEDMNEESAGTLSWFQQVGWPFEDGRTAFDPSHGDMQRLQTAFEEIAISGRYSRLSDLTDAAALPPGTLKAMSAQVGLRIVDDLVFPTKRCRAADRCVARVAEILQASDRPLHLAEISSAGRAYREDLHWGYRNLAIALCEAGDVISTDEWGLFDLLTRTNEGQVVDRRPRIGAAVFDEGPLIPATDLEHCSATWPDPHDAGFHRAVASTLQLRKTQRGSGLHTSICELLRSDERGALLRWLEVATPSNDPDKDECGCIGITLLAAYWAAAHSTSRGGWDTWGVLHEVAGCAMRNWIWVAGVPRTIMLDAVVQATQTLGLRHAFAHKGHLWVNTMRLQAGFHCGDLAHLRGWLLDDPGDIPAALRLLSQDAGTGISFILGGLRAAALGQREVRSVLDVASLTPWWPGWDEATLREALCAPPVSRPARIRRQVDDTEREDLLAPAPKPADGGPVRSANPGGGIPGVSPGEVVFSRNGSELLLQLPSILPFPPGAITYVLDGARAGGTVGDSGEVAWFARDSYIALPLAGPRMRTAQFFRDDVLVAEAEITLWGAEDFLRVVDLRSQRPVPLDPYRARLSLSGPHAILLHETLSVSGEADDEFPLDEEHRLVVFRSGLPIGLTVVCEGTVVWHYEITESSRQTVEVAGAVLRANGSGIVWGESTHLRPSSLPEAFVPTRAVIGEQVLLPSRETAAPGWMLGGYRVLPGSLPLSRRGRIEGFLNGQKVAIPLDVVLTSPPTGATLNDGQGWSALRDGDRLDRSRHTGHRLWAHLPPEVPGPWVVFEGSRPAVAFGQHGPLIGRFLHGLGESVVLAPGTFNQGEHRIQVAPSIDTGAVIGTERGEDGALRMLTSFPIGRDPEPVVTGWSRQGIRNIPVEIDDTGRVLTIRSLPQGTEGLALFRDGTWLGTTYLSSPKTATWNLLGSPDRDASFRLALDARLPVLDPTVSSGIRKLLAQQAEPFVPMLLSGSRNPAGQHAAGMLLLSWRSPKSLAILAVREHIEAAANDRREPTQLDLLAASAPLALVHLLASGWECIPRGDRSKVLATLALGTVPAAAFARMATQGPITSLPDAETALLHEAVGATRCDDQFLASRAESSVASLAWTHLKASSTTALHPNVLTALTLPSLRHWLTAALLMRLLAEAR